MLNRDSLRIALIAVAVTVMGFGAAYQFVEPSPPKSMTIATGSKTGAYFNFARAYAQILAREGVKLEILETGGSVDNIDLLATGRADVAFIQGGVGQADEQPRFQALASLYLEPLWVFTRANAPIKTLLDLADKPISAGGAGSGTWAVARQLLTLNGMAQDDPRIQHLSNADAARALLDGKIDAAFFVAAPSAPLVQDLLGAPGLKLLSFERAEAYTSRLRHLSTVTLHQGVISLSQNLPAQDVTLLAPAATLVTTQDLHPALHTLMVRAAIEIHGAGGLFEQAGQFPSTLYTDYPISADAQRYLKDGPSLLQRFLPFWAAVLFDRLAIMLLPLVTLLFPLFKILPPAYRWRVRSRVYRWYEGLADIERRARAGEDKARLDEELNAMAHEVHALKVPLSYADEVYNLRLHIDLVKRELGV